KGIKSLAPQQHHAPRQDVLLDVKLPLKYPVRFADPKLPQLVIPMKRILNHPRPQQIEMNTTGHHGWNNNVAIYLVCAPIASEINAMHGRRSSLKIMAPFSTSCPRGESPKGPRLFLFPPRRWC